MDTNSSSSGNTTTEAAAAEPPAESTPVSKEAADTPATATTPSVSDFRPVLDVVDAFFRLSSRPDQFLALSLLIPRLSPLQLSYTTSMAARYFDKVPYADGKKCDELRAQAGDTTYLNELYTRAFQADQVPDVLAELAQLLPVAQLSSSKQTLPQFSEFAKLVHLYANMLMHCINRSEDVAVQRFVQALAVLQPDVREHLIQNANSGGLPAIVTNGDVSGEEAEDDMHSFANHHRVPPKIIPAELMSPFTSFGYQQKSVSFSQHSPIGVCMSLPSAPASKETSSAVSFTVLPQTASAFANSSNNTQPPGPSGSMMASVNSGLPRSQPQHHQLQHQRQHLQLTRLNTMPEGTSLANLVNRQLNNPSSMTSQGCVFVMEGSGMRDVPIWLKNLRLHKYTALFEKMSYVEMINLTEEWLEANKVTKGATNKIMQNIQKLRERQSQLRHFEKELMQNPNVDVRSILDSLHQMMNTPMKRFTPPPTTATSPPQSSTGLNASSETASNISTGVEAPASVSSNNVGDPLNNMQWILGDDSVPEGDLPGQMTRLIGRLMCYFLIKSATQLEPSLLIHFIKLVDKCAQHEAFTDRHRALLSATKQRCSQFVHSQPPRSAWSPAGGGGGGPSGGSSSPGSSGGMGYRKARNLQSELRASPSVPASMPGSRNPPNGVVGDGFSNSAVISSTNPYNLSPPNRNYWMTASEQSGSNNGVDMGGLPLSAQYSLRAANSMSPLVSGRPPPHAMVTPPSASMSNAVENCFLAFPPPPALSPQGPPGFTKQFRPAAIGAKTPLGRTQSAPQTPPATAGNSLLMMSFASAARPQAWLSASQPQRNLTSPLAVQPASPTGSSTGSGGGNSGGVYGMASAHLALSPQNSSSGTLDADMLNHHHHHHHGHHGHHGHHVDGPSSDAEALANSQLSTLCLQMTDVCLNAPDFLEGDDKFNEQ